MKIRHDWTFDELKNLHDLPILDLISQSNQLHTQFHSPSEIQVCHLISIKTGGCPEDCKYCAQSSRYQTSVIAQPMMPLDNVIEQAKKALERGASRICLGAAWREIRDGKAFEAILEMIKKIAAMGLEVCCTLGMMNKEQAIRLKEAGLYAYNHNLDTSQEFYKTIITTRTYEERLATLDIAVNANLSLCCGGILGMGESPEDRLKLLLTLCQRNPHPESVPINRLSPINGTPLGNQPQIPVWEMIRVIAVARITMPKAMIRLSAGRIELSIEEQALCFLAGANSIFAGEKLLTVANTSIDQDQEMFDILNLKKSDPYSKVSCQ